MNVTITDTACHPGKRFPALDRRIARMLADERDIPYVYLIIKLSLIFLPFSAYLLLSTGSILLPGIIYLALFVVYMGPFILMVHNISHRRLCRNPRHWFGLYLDWILGPLFGETPNTYFVHHVGMHHPENNLPEDLNSTLKYRRDSILHFLVYVLEFIALGILPLGKYMWKKGRTKMLRRLLIGEICYWVAVLGLLFFNWQATIVVMILPLLICRFAMMTGNWAQHAFVDPTNPENSYRNSINCINSGYNQRCFNAGYHIGHHLKPTIHWSEMPSDFERNIESYAGEKAIVFRKIDFMTIWLFLMFKRYDFLARFYVHPGTEPISQPQIMAMLKERTQPIPQRPVEIL